MPATFDELERYYDAVPRQQAHAEAIGPFTLFVNDDPAGWPYYARPTPGAAPTSDAVRQVRRRQRELGVPEAFEWVAETSPAMADALATSGLPTQAYPLLVLDAFRPVPPAPGVALHELTAESSDRCFRSASAVLSLAFGDPSTTVGPAGLDDLDQLIDREPPGRAAAWRDAVGAAQSYAFTAVVDGRPVCAGSANPLEGVAEVVGVGTLPAFRRQGLALQLTSAVVRACLDRGMSTVFLSAGSPEVARIYQRLGFVRVGTACVAEPG